MYQLQRVSLLLSLLLVFLLAGCSGEPAASSSEEALPEPTEATIDLTIGVVDGEDAYMFGRVSGVTSDEEGNIYVVDAQTHEVRAFDVDGNHRLSFGEEGEGPGELSSPCCLGWGPEGRLWVRDAMNNRYNSYTVEENAARFENSIQMAHNSGSFWTPTTFDREGLLIDVGPAEFTGQYPQMVRHHLDADGETVSEITVPEPPEGSTGMHTVDISMNGGAGVLFFPQPFGSRALSTHSPTGEWAHGVSGSYEIFWMDEDRELLHAIERTIDLLPLSEEEKEQGRESIDELREQHDLTRGQISFGVPDYHTPISTIFFDRTGRLWVQHYTRSAEDNVADVYDRDGELTQVIHWPPYVDLQFGSVDERVAYGIQRRPDDVDRVVRLTF